MSNNEHEPVTALEVARAAADSARSIAMHCSISFIEKVKPGRRLTAHAEMRAQYGRNGIFDVAVKDDLGVTVAEFRGYSRTIGGAWVE